MTTNLSSPSPNLKDPFKQVKKKSIIVGNLSFSEEDCIGFGESGTQVYRGQKKDGTEVAIKRIDRNSVKDFETASDYLEKHLQDFNILVYEDFEADEDFYYLALELCECNLERYIDEIDTTVETCLKKAVMEILHGLQALHTAEVIHGALKPSNILIDSCNTAKLADYDISCKLKRSIRTDDTQSWEATEILSETEETHTKSSDIQVAGMLVYYILSGGEHPFGDIKNREMNIMNGTYSLEHVEDLVAKDLIEWMINREPENRLTIDEVLDHPLFWSDWRKVNVIRKLADIEEVESLLNGERNEELEACVKKHSEGKSFSEWKSTVIWKNFGPNLPQDLLGLLRFLRIKLLQEEMFLIEMTFDCFPDFFISLHRLAKERKWEY